MLALGFEVIVTCDAWILEDGLETHSHRDGQELLSTCVFLKFPVIVLVSCWNICAGWNGGWSGPLQRSTQDVSKYYKRTTDYKEVLRV